MIMLNTKVNKTNRH